MKSENKIFVAFIVNLLFSAFELAGGFFTGSVAIISDAFHDLGDAMSIGISYLLEKKSRQNPDEVYTYGYTRYSVLGGIITTVILLLGSIAVIIGAVGRIINPVPLNYEGIIIFAVVGVSVNLLAAYFTSRGESLNQKAVNLHMLEDVLGWMAVLAGGVVMKFADLPIIDPILSIIVALFILVSALKNLKEVLDLFLEKAPRGINVAEIKEHVMAFDAVDDVHHIHIRSLDGYRNTATMHIVSEYCSAELKAAIREELLHHGICHSTLEFETPDECCGDLHCVIEGIGGVHGHHHHHHH